MYKIDAQIDVKDGNQAEVKIKLESEGTNFEAMRLVSQIVMRTAKAAFQEEEEPMKTIGPAFFIKEVMEIALSELSQSSATEEVDLLKKKEVGFNA